MKPRAIPPVIVPADVYDAIIDHAREGKPEEICGVVRGRGLEAYEAVRGRNVAPERIENYEVDPQTLLLQFKFEEAGDEMMGVYHSHPVSVAYPSATDAWNAHYPECIYFICSLEYDDRPALRAFMMTPAPLPVPVETLAQELAFYETRPNLFAYYQPAHRSVPPALLDVVAQVPLPFYVVFYRHEDGTTEGRVVSVAEFPIQRV
ncbi:M67 family metallopeptidase [Litorilinea aerophila]|uniref:M67 family metallopeptidase n=1 Tax=Litorilinea aerophila TaxID=1204385 RepID=A0A540VDU6_9CHLR|nr:M67 family metallopeptidase [Litorilinea aerophila]MCC9077254.1 M67 family metallopeptidase [Litorilinea aerophila]